MDPNVIATALSIVVIIGGVLKIGGEIKEINARLDGIEARLGRLETEVHSINEYLRRPA